MLDLGLTKRQALAAVTTHQLTRTDADHWRRWVHQLDPTKTRPVAILAAAIKGQRLPPRSLAAAVPPVHDPPLPAADPPDAVVVPLTRSNGCVERVSLPALWHQVQARLQPRIADTEFETWIKPTMLLDLDERDAIIGVPNVFVRQEVEHHYRDALAEALRAEVERPVTVCLAIQPARMPGSAV